MSMNKTTVLASAVIAIVVVLGGWFILPPKVQQTVQNLGSLAGPDIPFSYLNWGGIRQENRSQSFNQASTTLCSLIGPAASSTLDFATAMITTATSSAIQIDFARSSIMDATTSLLLPSVTVGANLTGIIEFNASSTALSNGASGQFFGPNQRLNIKYGGTLGSLNTLGGVCKASFIVN